ncbi:MAG: SdrD B-like domain-containing protein [Pirellulales bacterium]
MTPRLLVDSDGRIAVPNNSAYADPLDGFEVVFDGSANGSGTYAWDVVDSNLNHYISNQPIFKPKLLEGDYTVSLSYNGGAAVPDNITVNDILIVTMGDSLSAGEGNPEVPLDGSFSAPEWMQVGDTTLYPPTLDSSNTGPMLGQPDVEQEQARYHAIASRSSYAAAAQMALELERLDPHSSVTFVFVASSGASIGGIPGELPSVGGGALSPFAGQDVAAGYDGDDPMPSQIAQIKDIINDRAIDVMTFSFGINDLAFTRIAKALLFRVPGEFDIDFISKLNDASENGTSQAWDALRQAVDLPKSLLVSDPVGAGTNGLAAAYTQFANALNDNAQLPGYSASTRTYMLEYFAPLSILKNGVVTTADEIMQDVVPLLNLEIDSTEIEWVKSKFLTDLRTAVHAAASVPGRNWTLINGIEDAFQGHGYSAPDGDRWIRTATEGGATQGPNSLLTTATLHPNRRGQAAIGQLLTRQAIEDLYDTVIAPNLPSGSTVTKAGLKAISDTYFQDIIEGPLDTSSTKTLANSLNNLIDFSGIWSLPGVDSHLGGLVDLDGLLDDVLGQLGEELTVASTVALGSSISGSQDQDDASFMVTLDDHGPVNIRLPLSQTDGTAISYSAASLVAALNTELASAGLEDLLVASIPTSGTDTGKLVFTTPSANSLTATTLQLRAANPAPTNGRVTTTQTYDIEVARGATSETYSIDVGTNPIPLSANPFVATAQNVNAADLAVAINLALKAVGLLDVVVLVDKGRDRTLDHKPSINSPAIATLDQDRLVLAATATAVTGIEINVAGTNDLGFSAGQSIDTSNNANPAETLLKFEGSSDAAGPESFMHLIDAAIKEYGKDSPVQSVIDDLVDMIKQKLTEKLQPVLQGMTDDATDSQNWPNDPAFETSPTIIVNPQFAANELTFHVELSHLFEKPLEWDMFEEGISLGPFGTIELGGTINASLIAPVTLKFDMGMYLGNLTDSPLNVFAKLPEDGGIEFDETTPLTALNGGKGVPLIVGMTATDDVPASGQLAGDASFTLEIEQYSSPTATSYAMTLALAPVGNSATPFTNNNTLPQHLADDLNFLFRQQGIHNLVRAEILIERDAQQNPLSTRLYLQAVDDSVIGLKISGSGGEALGFASTQSSSDLIVDPSDSNRYLSNWADLVIEVGLPTTAGGNPWLGNYRAYVNLDGARTLADVRDRIVDATSIAVGPFSIPRFELDINTDQQRLELDRELSAFAFSGPIYVLPGIGVPGVDRAATASALGVMRERPIVEDPLHPLTPEIIGQPLHGLGFNDRIFIDTDAGEDQLAIGLGLVADNVDVSAALGSLSFSLEGNGPPDAKLLAFISTVFKDPGTQSDDDRLYFTEEFTRPADVLDLDFLPAVAPPTIGIEGEAHFKIVADGGFINNLVNGPFVVPIDFDFGASGALSLISALGSSGATFSEFLGTVEQLKVDDLLSVVRNVASYLKINPNDATSFNIPLINQSVGDVVKFADAMLTAVDEFLLQIDVPAVMMAVNTVRTAASNLNVPIEARARLFEALDAIDRALAHAADVDLNGIRRLPARLLAAANQLAKAIEDETQVSGLNAQLVAALEDARDELMKLVPSLNTVEERLEDAVSDAINDAFGLTGTQPGVAFEFDYITDYNTADGNVKQPALIVGLGYDNSELLSTGPKTETKDLELSLKDGKKVTLGGATINYELYAGVEIDLGAGITLDDKKLFLLTKTGTTPVDVPFTQLTIDAGLSASVEGMLGFKSFDLAKAWADAELRAATHDFWEDGSPSGSQDDVPDIDDVIVLSGSPDPLRDSDDPDGRFIIVTAIYVDPQGNVTATVLNGAGLTPDYTITKNTAPNPDTYEVQIKRYPNGMKPKRLTVEYLTAATATISTPANRASFRVTFDAVSPSLPNTIGAVAFSDLVNSQINLSPFEIYSNGLLNASVDAELLGNMSEDIITLAISAEHPLQPQADFDEEALGELFEGLGFNLKTLVDGIEKFLLALENGLANDLLAKIPIGGADLAKKITLIKKLRENFVAPLREELCNNPQASGSLDLVKAAIKTIVEPALQAALGQNTALDVLELTNDKIEINLVLNYEETLPVDFDSGLAGLPIKADGQGGVEATIGFMGTIGFGVSQEEGFYLIDQQTSVPELAVTVGAALQVDQSDPSDPIPTSLTVDLFGLKISATDILDGQDAGTFVGSSSTAPLLSINFVDPSQDGHITLSDISSNSFLDVFQPAFNVAAEVHLLLEAGINDSLPSVQGEMHLTWSYTSTYNATTDQFDTVVVPFSFKFEDVGINLGDFLSRHIRPVLEQINKYIEPLQPVINLLKKEIPGVTQLSEARGNGPVTFLDLALQKNPEQAAAAKKFINALDTILRLSSEMDSLEPDELVFILQDELVIMDPTDSDSQTDLQEPGAAEEVSLEGSEVETGGTIKKAVGFVKQMLQSLEDLGVDLHILDVKNVISMLLHRPFDIVSYDVPRFDLDFTWEKSFTVWSPPPIDVRIGLDFGVFADLSVGYDSHGIDTGRFFDGFYFGDREEVFTGADIDEFGLSLGVRLAALLNLGVAKAGIEGEVRGTAHANWRDSNSDGKMHLDEMVRIVKQDGFLCLFDLGVDVNAIVRLVWEYFGNEGSKEFINEIILSIHHKCPLYELGQVVEAGTTFTGMQGPTAAAETGTLIIHAGPYADLRRRGNASDTHEDVKITQMAPGVMKVELLGLEQVFTDVKQIFMSGGAGDDSLLLIDVDVPVTALGGAGDDILVGTANADYLDGGAGNDQLRGRGGDDIIHGGAGDDLIFGEGRDSLARIPQDTDSLWGSAGADALYGGTGQDVIFAGGGNDTIVEGGAGRDVIFGEEGNDTLMGGTGIDLLVGGAGDDILLGEEGNDAMLGGRLSDVTSRGATIDGVFTNLRDQLINGMVHASFVTSATETGTDGNDVLKGGTGNDMVVGDEGSDFIYGGWGNDLLVGYLLGSVSGTDGDYIEGNPGDDMICGTDGVDTIFGGTNVDGSLISGLVDVLNDAGNPEAGGGYFILHCLSTEPVTIVDDPASIITGILYEDLDLDGVNELGEPILIGWTVELLDAQNAVVATVVTDSTGSYEFEDVESGNYTVREIAPAGWAPVLPVGGVLAVAISGAGGAQSIGDVDFGNRRDVGRIVVRKFHDLNADGVRQGSENLLDNWLVEVIGPDGSVFRRTGDFDFDGNGQIDPVTEKHVAVFDNLPAGDYVVRETPRTGWVQSSPSLASSTPDVRLAIPNDGVSELRSSVTDVTVGSASNVEVHFNIEHEKLAELEAFLIGPGGQKVALALAPDGTPPAFGYSGVFQATDDLEPLLSGNVDGTWTLVIRDTDEDHAGTLEEWALVLTNSESQQLPPYPATHASIYYPGTANENHVQVGSSSDVSLEFGNFRPATINGFKFRDDNGNAVQDDGERGLGGVMFFVDLNNNGVRDQAEPKGITLFDDPETQFDEAGYFTIGSVRPGSDYKVREELLSGLRQTLPADDGVGKVTPLVVSLDSGESVGTSVRELAEFEGPELPSHGLTFANQPLGAIHGTKWRDADGDGVRDAIESGWAGVRVYADLNDNGVWDGALPGVPAEPFAFTMVDDPQTVGVDETGRYWLSDLPIGEYIVREQVPDGSVQTTNSAQHVNLGAGEIVEGVDFGNFVATATIHGEKWSDLDGDGVRDPGEPGINGVTIYADLDNDGQYDEGEPTAVTMSLPAGPADYNGNGVVDAPDYSVWRDTFGSTTNLRADGDGSGVVDQVDYLLWRTTFGRTVGAPVSPELPGDYNGNDTVDNADYSVWRDTLGSTTDLRADGDGNRVVDQADYLLWRKNFGNTLERISVGNGVTDRAGHYWLDVPIAAGNVVIREVTLPGTQTTYPELGYHTLQLALGKIFVGVDFGNSAVPVEPGSIAGRKVFDENSNEVPDVNDIPQAGVMIYVDLNGNGIHDQAQGQMEPSAVTGEDGTYVIVGVAPGQWRVHEIVPSTFQQVFPAVTPYHLVTVVAGQQSSGVDFANQPIAPGSAAVTLPLVAIWEFEQNTFDTASQFVENAGIHDDNLAVVATPPVVSYVPGLVGDAVDLTSSVALETTMPGDLVLSSFTIEGFVFPQQPGLILRDDDFRLTWNAGFASLAMLDAAGNVIAAPATLSMPAFEWSHVAVTYDANTRGLGFYVDGSGGIQIVPAGGNVSLDADDTLRLGGNGLGLFDKWAVWNVPLDQPVLADHANFPQNCYGLTQIGAIHGYKFEDVNGNGIWDAPAEPPLDNWTIEITGADFDMDGDIDLDDRLTTVTDGAGAYWFTNLPPGVYTVSEQQQPGWTQTSVGGTGVNGGLNPVPGTTAWTINLGPTDVYQNVDFGNQNQPSQPGSIHGTKWNDLDHDGVRDLNEPGLAGVTVYADLNGNGQLDFIDLDSGPGLLFEPYTVTMADDPSTPNVDETGAYWLDDLDPGSYLIREVVPPGFVQSYPVTVPQPGAHHVSLASGQSVVGLDFGNYEPLVLLDGDDVVHAWGGNDVVYGDNRITVPGVISGGSLRDTLFGHAGQDQLFGQEEDDILWGGDPVLGTVVGTIDDDLIDGGAGIDEVRQTVDVNQTLTNTALTGQGLDQLISIERARLTGGAAPNTLIASAFSGPVTLIGLGGDDNLTGGSNDDHLDGGEGSDTLTGGDGDDTYLFCPVPALSPVEHDLIAELANQGVDTLDFSQLDTMITVDLNLPTFALQPGTSNVRDVAALVAGQQANLENVIGSEFPDILRGNTANNMILGLGGGDTIEGRDGDDRLDPGTGSVNFLSGGLGDDVFVITFNEGDVTLADAGGIDTLDFSALEVAIVLGIPVGMPIEHIIGGQSDDVFSFLNGASLPSGGTIDGQGGINLLDYSAYTSAVTVDLLGSVTGVPGGVLSIENVTGGQAGDTIRGTKERNVLLGGPGADTIVGRDGDDRIEGQAGSDTLLDGGAGNDVILGGADDDILHGGSGDDLLIGGTGNDTLDGQAGNDTYRMVEGDEIDTIGDTGLLGEIDVLDLQLVTSDLQFDILSTGNITVDFLATADGVNATNSLEKLLAGEGNDVFKFHGLAVLPLPSTIDGGGGANTLDYSNYTSGVNVNLSASTATGAGVVQNIANVTGSNSSDVIVGDDHANVLLGGAGDDQLHGGRGDDRLAGGPGLFDELFGGAGNDTYVVDPNLGTLTLHEDGGTVAMGVVYSGGSDTIDFSQFMQAVAFDLSLGDNNVGSGQLIRMRLPSAPTMPAPEHFENVIGSPSSANTLTGNAGNNLLIGGNANDVLGGGAGRDILVGGDGADTFDSNDNEEDIVITEITDYDDAATDNADRNAWKHILAVWTAGDLDAATRMARISSGVGIAALGGPFKLGSATIQDDLDPDNVAFFDADDWLFQISGSGSSEALPLSVDASAAEVQDPGATNTTLQFPFDWPAARNVATSQSRLTRDAAFAQIEYSPRQRHFDANLLMLLTEAGYNVRKKAPRVAVPIAEEREQDRSPYEESVDRFFAELHLEYGPNSIREILLSVLYE